MYEIYTDGASSPNLAIKPGGWAFVILQDGVLVNHFRGGKLNTTNQVMELTAMNEALKWVQANAHPGEKIRMVADSKYVINGLEGHWVKLWEVNGWRTSELETPKNLELWKEAYANYLVCFKNYDLEFKHVRGHKGNTYNELADKYAVKAKKEVGGLS